MKPKIVTRPAPDTIKPRLVDADHIAVTCTCGAAWSVEKNEHGKWPWKWWLCPNGCNAPTKNWREV